MISRGPTKPPEQIYSEPGGKMERGMNKESKEPKRRIQEYFTTFFNIVR